MRKMHLCMYVCMYEERNKYDKQMTKATVTKTMTITMTMEIAWFTSSASRTVNQSFCHHSITKSESKCRIVKSILMIQLTWKIVKALTNVAEMNCVENLKSKSKK